MAEIEFSVLTRDCLQGRHRDGVALTGAMATYVAQHNAAKATIDWRFSTHEAPHRRPVPSLPPTKIQDILIPTICESGAAWPGRGLHLID